MFSSDLDLAYDQLIDYYSLRFQIEMVFTQMTKRDLLAFGTSGDGIANFDVLTIDYDPVDEQFDQMSALGKGCSKVAWMR